MGKDLNVLANNRKNILLAELAAWLHDVGKCADAFLQPDGMGFESKNCQNLRVNPHKAVFSPQELKNLPYWSSLTPQRGQCARLEEAKHATALWRTLKKLGLSLLQDTITFNCSNSNQNFPSIPELILWGRPVVADKYKNFKNVLQQPRAYLSAILGWSHKKAHMEKDEKEKKKEPDGDSGRHIDSPFGYLKIPIQKLDDKLKEVLQAVTNFIQNRKETLKDLRKNYIQAPGDTRRPINEVTLWDWSSVVAALYKAEIARCVLKNDQRDPKDVQWRLLSIRTDGLRYLLSSDSIPDLLARKGLLKDAFDRVRILLEEVYPLGLEVYRDENGSVFVVPDIDDLLAYKGETREVQEYFKDKNRTIQFINHGELTLEELIKTSFKSGTVKDDPDLSIDFELPLDIKLSEAWDGQNRLPPIGKILSKPPQIAPDKNDLKKISEMWQDEHREEICSVCGFRPQGWGANDRNCHYCRKHHKKGNKYTVRCQTCKAISRRVCYVCMQRRFFRSKEWAENLNTTIWIDEVADKNGRVALIVGKFDLTNWLDGTLVRSLAVRTPNDQNGHTADEVAKNPSFARLRRIWETTKNFWEKVIKDTEENIKVNRRLYLDVEIESGELGPFHAYEIIFKGVKIPLLWDPDKGRLWIIDNLLYLANRWNMDLKSKSFDEVFNEVKSEFERLKGEILKIYDPGGYGKQGEEVATVRVKDIGEDSTSYSQVISILSERKCRRCQSIPELSNSQVISILSQPQVFMALIPADRAMEVVENIKTKYEREMGKVRNRLPLHLGVVFAHRMMPLRAILDAGKRMLEQKSHPLMWQVVCVARKQIDKGDNLPERFDAHQSGQFKEWYEITLKNGKQLTWYVPALMGDGQTEDNWYPYVFLASPDEPIECQRYYETENPWNSAHKWVVHAGELEPDNKIYFTPATFDFLFLESNVKRHDVVYDNNGRSRIMDRRKPYFLDEVEDLQRAWNLLSENLTSSQIHQMIDFIETTRENWFRYGEGNIWERSKDDDTFKEFCRSVVVSAEWENKPRDRDIENLTDWAVSGLLTEAFTLHHRMMKEEVKRDQEQKTT